VNNDLIFEIESALEIAKIKTKKIDRKYCCTKVKL
jgi:hypothetical protein